MRKGALRRSAFGLALLLQCLTLPSRALACVVGTGPGASCTESALNACLPGGGSSDGVVTFNCGGAAMITVTSTKYISADTTIDGGSLLTINGGDSVTVFSVNDGVKFTVQNLTIANGNSQRGGGVIYSSGGGIDSRNGVLVVTNCTFSGNTADWGGGINSGNGGTLTVTNSIFSGNSARSLDGGAIQSGNGPLTVTNSTFSGNSAAFYGGGITNLGTLTLTNSTFSGNSAGWDGGGIYNFSTLAVTNSTFSSNSADNGGGGIYNLTGTLTLSNSAFSGNSADYGGGIYSYDGPLTVTNGTFSGNKAVGSGYGYGNGGGIHSDRGPLTVTNSTFSGNSATGYGGGINSDPLTVTNSTFSGNSAVSNGGGICSGGALVVTNCTFSGNSAKFGGGIYDWQFTQVAVTNTILANSTSGGNCGGIISNSGHNIDDGSTCGFTGTGCTSTTGTSFCNTNPLLDPTGLKNNGGPTQTIAIQATSAAVTAGDERICSITGTAFVNSLDQRGFVRPGRGAAKCSIGAYEYNSPGPPTLCEGDCNGDRAVTVHEILTMVNIALGNTPVTACAAGYSNYDSEITVDVILAAVNNALHGCGG